ncbi:hypothetical protein BJV78DRAFT_1201197 [Lactifluus subvellereus]|nr:hypothetical protein BJV78DRAFT_1201197 [Lactifluus subvellereus]
MEQLHWRRIHNSIISRSTLILDIIGYATKYKKVSCASKVAEIQNRPPMFLNGAHEYFVPSRLRSVPSLGHDTRPFRVVKFLRDFCIYSVVDGFDAFIIRVVILLFKMMKRKTLQRLFVLQITIRGELVVVIFKILAIHRGKRIGVRRKSSQFVA